MQKQQKKEKIRKLKKSSIPKRIPYTIVVATTSFNNTIISVIDQTSNKTLTTFSCGKSGFKGGKRSMRHSTQITAEHVSNYLTQTNRTIIMVKFRGYGRHKKAIIKGLVRKPNVRITRIIEATHVPHNGCRLPKKRRR